MTAPYLWRCVCGASGRGEEPAQEHAKTCGQFGRPKTNPGVDEMGERP